MIQIDRLEMVSEPRQTRYAGELYSPVRQQFCQCGKYVKSFTRHLCIGVEECRYEHIGAILA